MTARYLRLVSICLAAGCLALPASAAAATETGDAGDLPGTAQDLTGAPVDAIEGSIATGEDQDVYRVCLEGGGSFSATTVAGTELDTQLFLFGSSGLGVYGNDDSQATRQSTLPALHELTPAAAGVYLLAITPYDRDPQSAAGAIFGGGGVFAPTGPGASQPLSSWDGRTGLAGGYRIALTGTTGCTPADGTAPTVDLRAPLDGAVYLLGQEVLADYDCADEALGSGLASCAGDVADGAPLDTSSVGAKTFAVEASDAAGNVGSAASTYRVVYDFRGFLWPVRDRPAVNRARAGRVALVRFSLNGFHGRRVLAAGYPRVAEVECGSGAEPADGEPARLLGRRRAVRWSRRGRAYVLAWKTRRSWAGSCRQLLLGLADGTVRRADYRFKR
jgi:hypothetical protein